MEKWSSAKRRVFFCESQMYDHSFSGTVITSPMATVDLSDNSDEEIMELVQRALSQGLLMKTKRDGQTISSRKKFVLLCELIITEYRVRLQEEKEYQKKEMEEKQKQLKKQMEEQQKQYDDFEELLSPGGEKKRKRVNKVSSNSSSSTLPPASPDNTEIFDVDQKITSCWYKNCLHKSWHPGKITAVHPPTARKNGIYKYDIAYDDKTKATNVALRYIKLLQ